MYVYIDLNLAFGLANLPVDELLHIDKRREDDEEARRGGDGYSHNHWPLLAQNPVEPVYPLPLCM